MTLENQVVSLELAKKLKEAGVPQESLFFWSKQEDLTNWKCVHGAYFAVDKRKDVAAFTVAELGAFILSRLHNSQDKEHSEHQFICEKWPNDLWNAAYICLSCKGNVARYQQRNEADARAMMLLFLIEHGLVDPKTL